MAYPPTQPVSQLKPLSISGWKGLDYTLPNTQKDKSLFTDCSNVNIVNGEVIRRTGHTLLKALLTTPVSMGCFQTFLGEWYLLAFSATKVYKWNTTTLDWDDISGAITLTGDANNTFSTCAFLNTFYFTNRVDNIHKWTGTGNIADASIAYKAKIVLPFGERLCLYNTVESGVDCYQRVRWAVVGSASTWTGTGSGFEDLVSSMGADSIIAAEILGNTVVIYGEEHIIVQRHVGGSRVFGFDPYIINKGLIGKDAIIAFPHTHIFIARDNIYTYSGGTNINAIGNPIISYFFGAMNPNARSKVFMEYHEDTRFLYIFFPSITSTVCDLYLCYDMVKNVWTKGTALNFVCGTRFRTTSATTIGDITVPIGDITWKIGDSLSGVSYPYAAYGCSDKVMVRKDPIATTDNGTAYTGYFDTYDMTLSERPDSYQHFFELLSEYKTNNALQVSWSKDEGASWTSLANLPVQVLMTTSWKDLDINEKKVRFRISGTNVYTFRSLMFTFFPGTHIL